MNFLTLKNITIKSLVTLANLLAFIALLVVFLSFIKQIESTSLYTVSKIAYILLGFAIAIFVFYHILRSLQIKKSSFQFLKRHKIYNNSFYYAEYLCFCLNLIIIILIATGKLVNKDVIIVFWVFSPVFIIVTMIASVLESIVRVEERIFINQQQISQDNSNKVELETVDNSQTIQGDVNPFLPIDLEKNQVDQQQDNEENN